MKATESILTTFNPLKIIILFLCILFEFAIGLSTNIVTPLLLVGSICALFIIIYLLTKPELTYAIFVISVVVVGLGIFEVSDVSKQQITGRVLLTPREFISPILFLVLIVEVFGRRKLISFRGSPADASIFILLLWALTTLFFSANVKIGITTYVKILYCIVLFYMTINLLKDESFVDKAIQYWVVASLISALLVLIQFFLQNIFNIDIFYQITGRTSGRTQGFGKGPNVIAAILVAITPLTLASYLKASNKKAKLFYSFTIFVNVLAILSTISRLGIFGLVVSFSYFAFWVKEIRKFLFKLILIMLICTLIIGSGTILSGIWKRYSKIQEGVEALSRSRTATYAEAIQIIKQHPIIGIGLGSYSEYIESAERAVAEIGPHSLFLYVWMELGIPGVIIVLWIFSVFAYTAFKTRRNIVLDRYRYYVIASTAGILPYLFASPFQNWKISLPHVWAHLGLVICIYYVALKKLPEKK
jgi:O-antigen ligase